MANPQPTDSHLRLAVTIQDELTLRDFTKRQYKIINLILRVSWACGKKYAVIPQYTKYFRACGIHKSDIKKEINTLIKNNVLSWEQSTNVFEFNKNFDAWLIPYHPDVEKDAIKELISLNLKSWQNTNPVGKTQTKFGNNTNSVGEISELTEAGNADGEQETGEPITSIITSIYNDYFEILKQVENYPFNQEKDSTTISKLIQKYPDIDLLAALDKWSTYKLDKPLNKGSNPRSQIINWVEIGVKNGKYKKQKEGTEYVYNCFA